MLSELSIRGKQAAALTVSLFLICSGPGLKVPTAAANMVAQTVVAPAGPTAVAPVTLGSGAQMGPGGLSAAPLGRPAGLSSALPTMRALNPAAMTPGKTLAALPGGLRAGPAAMALPRVAALAPLHGAKAANTIPARTATPTSSQRGSGTAMLRIGRRTAAARVLFKRVRSEINGVGPVSQASPSTAKGLGTRLLRMLRGFAAKNDDSTPEAPSVSDMGKVAKGKKAAKLRKPSDKGVSRNQKRMLDTLHRIASIYAEHYAPIEWKESRGVDIKAEYKKARDKVLASPKMTTREFQNLLAGFVTATKDYHAGIMFYSTELARLPLYIMGAGGRYFIAYVNRQEISKKDFPYEPGDEVLEFDGKPVGEVVRSLVEEAGPNIAETDTRMAEMRLTSRIRQLGMNVPTGMALLKIKTQAGKVGTAELAWDYSPEMVPTDVPVRDGRLDIERAPGIDDPLDLEPGSGRDTPTETGPVAALVRILRKLIPTAAHPHARALAGVALEDSANPFMVGARESFVPKLGKVIWEIDKRAPLHAYIYENEQGKRVGYLRIPHYMGNQMLAGLVAQVIMKFQQETDSLVIDQVNNPGGDMFYMYTLLSFLATKPMPVPKHRMIIDESDAYMAAQMIKQVEAQKKKQGSVREALQQIFSAAPDAGMQEKMLGFARFILSELKAGRRLTGLVHLFGLDKIDPNPQVRYTKPVVVLANALDFSAGDFFPAILQDSGRAKVFGVRTSGAGGGVKGLQFPNQFGIAQLAYTWTLAMRANGQPIENLGVTPDIGYEITPEDLRNGFSGYKTALNAALSELMGPSSPVKRKSAPSAKPEAVKPEKAAEEAAPEAAGPKAITPEELQGREFASVKDIPFPQMPQAKLTIAKDGSWKVESKALWDGKGKSGKKIRLQDRKSWDGQEGQLLVLGQHGGPVVRLTETQKAQLKKATGKDFEYQTVFFYGSVADGEWVLLFS